MKCRPTRYDGTPDAETEVLLDVTIAPGGMLMADGKPFTP